MIKQKTKRKKYSIVRSEHELRKEIQSLPDSEVYKFVSDGGFSSISFILFITKFTTINEMFISSFRIGKKELQLIDALHKKQKIGMCHFAVGKLMRDDNKTGKHYGYYDNFLGVCAKNEWEHLEINNHSKILLFDTDMGKYVLETSSNLNENPKIEQFSFEKDNELFEFYRSVFERWRDKDG